MPHFIAYILTILLLVVMNGLCDCLIDIPWDDIFKFIASAAASYLCEWVQVGIDVYISRLKY